MAQCITQQFGNTNSCPYFRLTVTTSGGSASNGTCTVSWVLDFVTPSSYTWNGATNKPVTCVVDGRTVYNASTSVSGTTRNVSSGSFTANRAANGGARAIAFSISCNYDTASWSGVTGGVRSGSGSVNTPSITRTYTVAYNANGGSGAPSNQTKTHGTNLTLSSTKPTKAGYIFQGWAKSSTATSPDYLAGGTYSSNANVTLYAVWMIGNLIELSFNTQNLSIASKTGGVANLVDFSVPFSPVYDANTYNVPFYYKVCYVDDNSGNVANIDNNSDGTIYGPFTQKDIGDGGGDSTAFNIPISAELLLNSLKACRSETSVKFLVVVSTSDNSFKNELITKNLLTVSLVNFNILYSKVVRCYRDGNNTYLKLEVKFPKSYTSSHIKANFPQISIDGGSFNQLTTSDGSATVGTDNLVTYIFSLSSSLLSTGASHSIELKITDNLYTALAITRVGSVGGEDIWLYENGKIKATEFIETDEGFMLQKGGRFYAGEFIETDTGLMIGDITLCGELVEE